MMLIDPFRISAGPMTLAFIAVTGSGAVNLPTITFSSVNIGTAHARRKVIISIYFTGAGGLTPNITSATIGGVIAAIDEIGAGITSFGIYTRSAIISADVPTGTTAAVVLNFSTSTQSAQIGTYRATNAIYPSPIDTQSVAVPTTGATVNIDVKNGGAVVATANMDLPASWSGVTGEYSVPLGSVISPTGGGDEMTADATGYAVTCNGSGLTAGAPRRTLIAASYR